ncbi:MAG: DUF4349 domain-containing protein [Oscillospiraceae bacterium]|nr:DUF4349 domain-containing protein [Oscillospiraceae bacterium]
MKRKNRVKKIAIGLAALFCLSGIVGCSMMDSDEKAVGEMAPHVNPGWGNNDVRDDDDYGDEYDNEYERSEYADEYDDEVAGAEVSDVERKVIRNASMRVETRDESATDLYARFVEKADALGGYEFSMNMSRRIEKKYGVEYELTDVTAELRVPPEKLGEFMTFVGDNSRVMFSKTDSEDVTAEFYDLQTRLETKRGTLIAYNNMLENAEDLDEILKVQRMIDQITEEIEAIEGRLKVLRSLTGMSRVSITMSQVIEYEEEEEEEEEQYVVDWNSLTLEDMGWLIRNGFVTVTSGIITILQWLVIAMAVTSPLWIPVVILIVVLVRRARKRRFKRYDEIIQKEAQHKEEMAANERADKNETNDTDDNVNNEKAERENDSDKQQS